MTKPAIKLASILKSLVSKDLFEQTELGAITISGLSIDSRKIVSGDAFIAYPGQVVDGRSFIEVAINKGAKVIIAEAKNLTKFLNEEKKYSVEIIPVVNLAEKVSQIAGEFYQNPSKNMTLVGVTGTNGKTSVCYLAAQALDLLQKPTVLLSTLGNGAVGSLKPSVNTTSDPVTIQQTAAEYLQQSFHHLCMEVSSHGLDQKRVSGLNYKVAVFTNLSLDHLDYHGDMEAYYQAKRQLFLRDEVQYVVINADDLYGKRLLEDNDIKAKKIGYTRNKESQISNSSSSQVEWVVSENELFNLNGISADIKTPWGTGRINSSLLGDFNLSNLLAVTGILGVLFGDVHKWIVALNGAKAATGRMQRFTKEGLATLVVDYAHTPDALEKSLATLRHHCEGNLWCLFGCGGDRDTSKRSVMGSIAESHSQKVILTDDNPRTEDAKAIVQMIREGMNDSTVPYIASRKEAINYALNHADESDMVLIAGKGHEDYQEIDNEKLHYSDLETVETLMGAYS